MGARYIPPRSQSIEAMERANEVRCARAELKRDVKAGHVALGELLAEPELPDWLEGMPIEELLGAVRRVGQKRSTDWLRAVPIKPGALVRELTYRKRRLLAASVTGWEIENRERSERRARPSVGDQRRPDSPRRNFSTAAKKVA